MYISEDDMPLFMKNKEWYYFDEKECLYKPTDKAPSEVIESIIQFNSEHNGEDENGNRWTDF